MIFMLCILIFHKSNQTLQCKYSNTYVEFINVSEKLWISVAGFLSGNNLPSSLIPSGMSVRPLFFRRDFKHKIWHYPIKLLSYKMLHEISTKFPFFCYLRLI